MEPQRTTPVRHGLLRRIGVIGVSAIILTVAITGTTVALATPALPTTPAAAQLGQPATHRPSTVSAYAVQPDDPPAPPASIASPAEQLELARQAADAAAAKAAAQAAAAAAAAKAAAPKPPAPKPAAPKPAAPKPAAAPVTYRGTNHFWFPSLGINHSVGFMACNAPAVPGSSIYRWGCAGANNVYLLAHAWAAFKPLYNAYYSGRLKTGMLAVYADGAGRVHYFRLQWYKVTAPLASSHWAWDPQPVSSLTLQTCVGPNSSLRLFVRFTEVPKP